MSQSTDITFEAGYRRLQEIADRLGSDEVPVHEMCDLFAEGKGLEQALGTYLSEQRERVEAIERGQGLRAFRVVPPGGEERTAVAGAANGASGGAANGASGAAANGAAAAANGSSGTTANGASVAANGSSAPAAGGSSTPPVDAAPAPPPQDEVLPF